MERIKTKAQFFTIDALIALTIIIITIIAISPTLKQSRQESTITADILESLDSLKIGEFDNIYTQQLIANGKITDTTKSVLEQIGEFYVTNITIAQNLAEETLSSLSPNENIGIWYGSILLASQNITPFETAENVVTNRQVISGIGGNGTGVTGFSTRASLSSSSRTDYAYFGGYVGEGNITMQIDYEGTINSATIELVINNDFEILVNNISLGNFSKSPDDFTPVSYNLSTAFFTSGQNTLEIKGDSLHIAGGFIKISYDSLVTYEQPAKYYFPGIEGIINLYDGFHIPGNLTGLTISLHFNNSINTFLTLGKTQVFNSSSDGTSPITITNATLATLLNYSDLSKKTIPIRFGMEDMDYVTNDSKDIDVFSATDISGSMRVTCSGASPWYCCWFNDCSNEAGCNSCGGTITENKIQDAKDANNLFIEMILNETDNRVGLTAYASSASDTNYHALSNNEASLKSEVNSWNANGGTCICCGINKAVAGLLSDSNSSKFQSIVMMSDGNANTQCTEQGTGSASGDAIQAACDAYNNHGIKVYTIGFGSGANVQTLTQMASCADGSFYSAVDDLVDIYETIAEELIQTAYYEQTVQISGDFFSQLFPDSYIEFDYTKESLQTGLLATIEQPFSSADTATFSLPANSTLLEAATISYSGPRWTSLIEINNQTIYNLSDYQTDFLKLGDPYSVNIPPSLTSQNNTLTLQTGLSSSNTSTGSINNKIIYTISKDLASYTSVSSTADGCNWTIQFNTYNLTTPIPSDYSGTQICEYSSSPYCGIYTNCEGATDSTQIATYNIFKLLDFDSDGKVDVELSNDDMQITTSNLEGVPFLFSTEVQIRKWH
ncbi:VWA domain-containing protein [Candidatus Pacearchaeota archaeon]|nr:VWA domain-containing protein [Candidatus Pacearchaeota archaeon]